MSYIMDTIKCRECGKHMNIATGTFGSGIPKECGFCKKPLNYEVVSAGWCADENGNLGEDLTKPKPNA